MIDPAIEAIRKTLQSLQSATDASEYVSAMLAAHPGATHAQFDAAFKEELAAGKARLDHMRSARRPAGSLILTPDEVADLANILQSAAEDDDDERTIERVLADAERAGDQRAGVLLHHFRTAAGEVVQ